MRILVVDDEKAKRLTLRDALATQGHEVVTAADGEEALRKLGDPRFDVVVTDLRMPKADGIEGSEVRFWPLDALQKDLVPIHADTLNDFKQYDGQFLLADNNSMR